MLTFTYQQFESHEADDDLWAQVVNALNGLNAQQRNSVKIASSDQDNGPARTVLIYTGDDEPAGSISQLGESWSYTVFSTGSDYTEMYQECVDFLNGDELTDLQKYYSRISMTNAHSHKSNLVVWYRNMS